MWPGTTISFKIEDAEEIATVKVITTRVPKLDDFSEKSNVVEIGKKKGDGLMVICGDGSVLELLEVQPPMKKRMDGKSYWNGLRGKKLEWVTLPEAEE